LFIAVAIAIAAIDGTLHVTQALNGLALGNAPAAQKNNMAYLALYASAGSTACTSQPMAPMIDDAVTCQPREL
jgi:hypothetical protein